MKSYVIYFEDNEILYTSYLDLTNTNKAKIAQHNVVFENEQFYLNDKTIEEIDELIIKECVTKHYFIKDVEILTFGNNKTNNFIIESDKDINLIIDTKSHTLSLIEDTKAYLNGKLITNKQKIENGDRIYFLGYEIIYNTNIISFVCAHGIESKHLEQDAFIDQLTSEQFDYQRSPRIIHQAPLDMIEIMGPGTPPQKPTDGLAKLIVPPLIMLAATILMAIMMPRGLYALVGALTTLVTIIFNISSYIERVKKHKKDTADRIERYTVYLQNTIQRISDQIEAQKHAANYHLPNVNELSEMALNYNHRIFEKAPLHHDFLEYRVGIGQIEPSFDIKYEKNIMELHKEDLVIEADTIYDYFNKVEDIPIGIDLLHGPIGYVGRHELVIEQLQLMLLQLAFFHSYLDVEFLSVFSEEEYPKWHPLRWLPHFKMNNLNVRSMVYHQKGVDQVLNSLAQVLKQRQSALKEKGQEKMFFSPHYVIVISDEKLIFEHPIYELIEKNPLELGVSVIYTNSVVQKLPEFVETIIEIKNEDEGQILIKEGKLLNQKIKLDYLASKYNYEIIPRRLAGLNHIVGVKNSIPESVNFLEMYKVNQVEQLNVLDRYAKAVPHKTLAVPLGYRAKDDIVYLNLHEKAHGPHGLVAGTTGSGKSEIVQSYIISLALNFHPYDVAFLLIDYKGGGMANLFKDLPHHLGSITNLDGSQSMRALVSINAELKRRQRIFGEYEVNHINQYHKLFKEGVAKEPIPHLFLISDEFAELKAEQPEFMKELVSTARIGRSLGVHLILATQKPSGVVDDQIWSNSKFKLALKVQNASDSNEVLKTPDAANITLPGRAYLQVGNNEIYELFQSAYSGADYVLDEEITEVIDNRIYKINDMGQYELISQDLSGLKDSKDKKVVSQLDAVIDYIGREIEETDFRPVARPWLPPLPTRVASINEVDYDIVKDWSNEDIELKFNLGLVDLPHLQSQDNFEVNLSEDGHFAVYSSPGFGKSSVIQTILMDISRKINPEYLEMFLLDFGTNALLPLKNLPSVADLVLADDNEKMNKLIVRLMSEIKRRKKLCQEVGAPNIGMYEKLTKKKERRIVVAIDNYDVIKEGDLADSLEPLLTQISREGLSVGIHLIISASRQNAMRYTMSSNIKQQMCLFMIDHSEISTVVGRSDYKIEELAGRGMVKVEDPALIQVYLPVEGADNVEILENLNKEVNELSESYAGARPKSIPIMPETIEFTEFMDNASVKKAMGQEYIIPIGYDYDNVESANVNFNEVNNFFISGGTGCNELDVLENIIKLISMKGHNVTIIDNGRNSLNNFENKVMSYYGNDMAETFIENIYSRYIEDNDKEEELNFIVISNISDFVNQIDDIEEKFEEIFINAKDNNLCFIFAHENDGISGYGGLIKKLKTTSNGMIMNKLSDQDVYSLPYIPRENDIENNDGYLIVDGKYYKIKSVK